MIDVNGIVSKYIGIPFKDHGCGFDGCDCYGLVSLLYKTEFGLHLPQIGDLYEHAYNRKDVNNLLEVYKDWEWSRIVDSSSEPLQPFDMLVFRIAGTDHHVGLYISPGYMLHVVEGSDAGIERYDGIRWKRQLHRIMRHKEHEARQLRDKRKKGA